MNIRETADLYGKQKADWKNYQSMMGLGEKDVQILAAFDTFGALVTEPTIKSSVIREGIVNSLYKKILDSDDFKEARTRLEIYRELRRSY